MRKPLIAGNWKMHGSTASASELADTLGSGRHLFEGADMVVFPPAVYIQHVAEQLVKNNIAVGGQTVSEHAKGAYTGEISAGMLKDLGCSYVLVGHSERRALYVETSQSVAEKFKAAQENKLTPILCVGESLLERQQDKTFAVINSQIAAVIDLVGLEAVCNGVVAYEPVWAIGTGQVASPEQAQEVHATIRKQLGEGGSTTRLLYGGSVKSSNAAALFSQPDIDGGLVGGASLEAEEFLKIAQLTL